MQVKVTGTKYELFLEGPISEKTPLYEYNIKQATDVVVNMEKVTFINSIGVKNWILWTVRVPQGAKLTLTNCPFVIVSQANIVHGFLPVGTYIESFYAPFICPSCSAEKTVKLERGKNYQYATASQPSVISLPEDLACPKCGEIMEGDFISKKTFGFLDLNKGA